MAGPPKRILLRTETLSQSQEREGLRMGEFLELGWLGRSGSRSGGGWRERICAFAVRATLAIVGLAVASGAAGRNASAQSSAPPLPEPGQVQLVQPPSNSQGSAPVTVTLKDALDRARKLDLGIVSAEADEKSAREDRLQARNVLLPQISGSSQYLNTQGNGATPDGRFVTNDGVHVYREWGVLRQDLSPANLSLTGYHRAQAAEALAKAKTEIARRGLVVTVTKYYYALAVAQRKYATAQQALDEAQQFLRISQAQEREGQAAHVDVVKAQIQYDQQQTAFDDARLAMEGARLDLAVILFPTLDENFTVVDDLDSPSPLPTFAEVQQMASQDNPDLRVAMETLRQADLDVKSAQDRRFCRR